MRHWFHTAAWFLMFAMTGWFIGAILYWTFTSPSVVESVARYWQDYLFFLVCIFISWVVICVTWPKDSSGS